MCQTPVAGDGETPDCLSPPTGRMIPGRNSCRGRRRREAPGIGVTCSGLRAGGRPVRSALARKLSIGSWRATQIFRPWLDEPPRWPDKTQGEPSLTEWSRVSFAKLLVHRTSVASPKSRHIWPSIHPSSLRCVSLAYRLEYAALRRALPSRPSTASMLRSFPRYNTNDGLRDPAISDAHASCRIAGGKSSHPVGGHQLPWLYRIDEMLECPPFPALRDGGGSHAHATLGRGSSAR